MPKSVISVHARQQVDGQRGQFPTAREIDRFDRRKGYQRIGFHFVIERDGTRQIGRDLSTASVHDDPVETAKVSIGVALAGTAEEWTEGQLDALGSLIEDLKPHLMPDFTVKGVGSAVTQRLTESFPSTPVASLAVAA